MSYVLVKLLAEEAWDVYPMTCLRDQKVAAVIARKPTSVCCYTGKVFDMRWSPSEEPSPAYLVAAGLKKMEKLHTELARHCQSVVPVPAAESVTPVPAAESLAPVPAAESVQQAKDAECSEHKADAKRLWKEVKELESQLREAENRHEAAKMVKRLERMIDRLQGSNTVTPDEEDTGNGVFVSKALLDRLSNTFNGNPCRFVRNLARVLFTAEELHGHSLYGRTPNAKKGTQAKRGPDKSRLDAVVDYTSSKFGTPAAPLKKSLAAMVLELKQD